MALLSDYCLVVNHDNEFPYSLYKGLSHDLVFSVLDRPAFLNDADGVDVSLFVQSFPDMGSFYTLQNGSVLTTDLYDLPENFFIINGYVFSGLNGLLGYVNSIIPTPIVIPSPSSSSSLNGNGCEFKDNTIVNVVGRDIQYTVLSSMYYLLEDNSYTVLYALQSPTGETLNCPESFCTRYVPPVTAT